MAITPAGFFRGFLMDWLVFCFIALVLGVKKFLIRCYINKNFNITKNLKA
jgi:hypothetical protein